MTASLGSDELNKRLAKALRLGGDTHTVDDIRQAVARGNMQCFVRGDSFIVTEVNEYPRKRVLNVFLAVGEMDDINSLLMSEVKQFAKEAECHAMQGYCRPGWKKVLPKLGWKQSHILFTYDMGK